MRNGLAAGMVLALAGCATADLGPTSGELIQMVGDRYAGRPVADMAARYGMPDAQARMGGEVVYSWRASRTLRIREPTEARRAGFVGDPAWGRVPYVETITALESAPYEYRCQLDAYVRPDGVVRTIGLNGKLGACDLFAP